MYIVITLYQYHFTLTCTIEAVEAARRDMSFWTPLPLFSHFESWKNGWCDTRGPDLRVIECTFPREIHNLV